MTARSIQKENIRGVLEIIISDIGIHSFGRLFARALQENPKENVIYPYMLISILNDEDEDHSLSTWWQEQETEIDRILGEPEYYPKYRALCIKVFSAFLTYFSKDQIIDFFSEFGGTKLISYVLINDMTRMYQEYYDTEDLSKMNQILYRAKYIEEIKFDGEYEGDLDSTVNEKSFIFDGEYEGDLDSTDSGIVHKPLSYLQVATGGNK